MRTLHLDLLRIEPMACGRRHIVLTESVSWEEFPDYAEQLARQLSVRYTSRIEDVDTRLWAFRWSDCEYYLAIDPWSGVTVEPQSASADQAVDSLRAALSALRTPPLATGMVALMVLGPCVAVPLGEFLYFLVTGLWASARS